MRNKKVVVTGGAGFIGSHLVDTLVQKNANVTVLDDFSEGKRENINKEAEVVEGDVREISDVASVLKDVDFVFHMAAVATTKESSMGWTDPVRDYQVNMVGTLNILRTVANSNQDCHVLYASSAAVYGPPRYLPIDEKHPTNPISPYGVTKLAGEKYAHAFHAEKDVDITTLRIFNTYGSRQPRYVMYDLMQKIIRNPEKLEVIGSGKQIREFMHVSDTVRAFILAAMNRKSIGNVYNVSVENPVEIRELVDMIIEVAGTDTEIEYTGKSWTGDIDVLRADTKRIRQDIGFEPKVELEDGLNRLWKWVKNQHEE